MKPDQKLDFVLSSFNNSKDYEYSQDVRARIDSKKIGNPELDLIMEQLIKDDYISSHRETSENDKRTYDVPCVYRITFHGQLFLSRGGYQGESKALKEKYRLTKAATAANIANAIIIILIAASAVLLQRASLIQSEQTDARIIKLEQEFKEFQNSTKK